MRKRGETLDYILLHCRVVRELWHELFLKACFPWMFLAHCNSLMMEEMAGLGTQRMAKVLWKCTVISLMCDFMDGEKFTNLQ